MSTINESLSRVASGLLNPKSQKPTLDQRFTQLTYEFQQIYNELDSTNLPWTYNSQTVNIASGQTDYLVTNPTGKVLFVIAHPQDAVWGPVSLEFADLADISSDFFLYSPLDYGFSPDFNEAINFPFPFQIAFYRKDNDLWFRLPPFAYTLASIQIVYSTGDWLQNLTTESTALLSQYHSLPEVRAMMNLLPGCEWSDDKDANQLMRSNLAKSLTAQEQRYATSFIYGKRGMTVDATTERLSFGEW